MAQGGNCAAVGGACPKSGQKKSHHRRPLGIISPSSSYRYQVNWTTHPLGVPGWSSPKIISGVQKPQKELQEDCLAPKAPCPPRQTGLNLIPGLNQPGNLQRHSQACDGRYGQFLCPKADLEAHSGLLLQLNEPHRHPEVALSPIAYLRWWT